MDSLEQAYPNETFETENFINVPDFIWDNVLESIIYGKTIEGTYPRNSPLDTIHVDSIEQDKIVQQAMRKNHMMTTVNNVNESIKAQDNINDIVELVSEMNRNKEPLLHCSVFIELKADTEDKLRELQNDARMELTRAKISVDRLILRQKEG